MRRINAWLIIGIIGVCVFGYNFGIQYGRAMFGPKDMWWTPKAMALPLEQTSQEFELFVNDELLQSRIKQGTLLAIDREGKTYPVVSEDVSVRLNNWHKIKASFLHSAAFTALLLGISLMSLIIGAIQCFGNKMFVNKPDAGDA
ncbi:MAG: hypothetical protein JW927_21660 [Deltaproteobacteria bacterium]|nr:hypothetical protein [Deltaproteobacteria bacterium]